VRQYRPNTGRHWFDRQENREDGFYIGERRRRKQTSRFCRGKAGVEHDFQPHDKYPWVKGGKADYGMLELPWELHFRKCTGCGREKVFTVKRQDFDPVKREKDWELTKKINGFEEMEEEE
jgi:hypothetical protein